MTLQFELLLEALRALVTAVGLLPGVSPHMDLQGGAVTEALRALVTAVGLLVDVSLYVTLEVAFLPETLHALVAPVRLLVGVGTHVDDHLGIVGENFAAQDTGPALAAAPRPSQLLTVDEPLGGGQRAHSLQFARREEGVMAVRLQWALPFPVDAQDPQLPVVT